MGLFLVVGLPILVLIHSLLIHQTLLGNYPMIGRWQMHRYLLRQSMNFFANEFAGRVATKVMQTSLAIRESVIKLLDVFVYVSVYFISMMVLVASSELIDASYGSLAGGVCCFNYLFRSEGNKFPGNRLMPVR